MVRRAGDLTATSNPKCPFITCRVGKENLIHVKLKLMVGSKLFQYLHQNQVRFPISFNIGCADDT